MSTLERPAADYCAHERAKIEGALRRFVLFLDSTEWSVVERKPSRDSALGKSTWEVTGHGGRLVGIFDAESDATTLAADMNAAMADLRKREQSTAIDAIAVALDIWKRAAG